MNKTTYQKQHELARKLPGYWGTRAIAQLKYLDELVKLGQFGDEALADKATDFLYEKYKAAGTIGRADVEEFETLLAPASSAAKAVKVSCVGHAHIDMNWMWAFDETALITIETFRTMLQLMKEYPDFTFLQSQAAVYKIVEQFAPELLPEIRERIRGGQWEVVASSWIETDKNMPNGESLTRHMLYTRRYLKNLLGLTDDDFRIDFEPDTFGHTAQVPEILTSGGVQYYYHCRGYDGHSLYRWEAPSGARVTAMREPTWYNHPIGPETFLYIPAYCAQQGIDRMCHIYGVGDHGGGATRRDIERILDMASWPCMPSLGFGKLGDFFQYIDTLELPVVKGELNFVFDGCYTTQTRIKKGNRDAENALNTAETLDVFSALCGGVKTSPQAFAQAWENVLFNQFHDILPGSGVRATREYAMGMYQRTLACAGVRTNAAVRALSGAVNTAALLPENRIPAESAAEGGGVGFGVPSCRYAASAGTAGGEKRLFSVFNPTQADWNGLVELTVWDWENAPGEAVVRDENGELLPLYLVDAAPLNYWQHLFFRVLVSCKVPAFGYRTLLLEENDAPLPLPAYTDPRVDRPVQEYVLENGFIRSRWDSKTFRLLSLCDKETGQELLHDGEEGGGLILIDEDDGCGMTSWRVGRHMRRRPAAEIVRLTGYSKGELRSSLSFEAEMGVSRYQVSAWLDKGERMLRLAVHCRWQEIGEPGKGIPQLAFRLPLAASCECFTFDAAFASVERGPVDYDVPAGSYAFAPAGQKGLLLVTDSKYGFRCTKDAMGVTLIRSSFEPDPLPETGDHDIAIGIGVPENTDSAVRLDALRFCRAPIAAAAASHTGALAPAGQLLALDAEDILVSAVKEAEDGSGDVILRLVELGGRSTQADLQWFLAPKAAVLVDAHEEALPQSGAKVNGNRITLPMRPYGVTAVRITF